MSCFLIDKKFSELYEKYISDVLGMTWNKTNKDDHGIDIYDNETGIYIDVKCYAAPKFVRHFKGVFIETFLCKSGRDGWLIDDSKKTTHYILLQDCSREMVNYTKGWIIKREQLKKALDEAILNGDAEEKIIPTAGGYMLPYCYLDAYCDEKFNGKKYIKELLEEKYAA